MLRSPGGLSCYRSDTRRCRWGVITCSPSCVLRCLVVPCPGVRPGKKALGLVMSTRQRRERSDQRWGEDPVGRTQACSLSAESLENNGHMPETRAVTRPRGAQRSGQGE
ncbi:unnamed protein product [Rangifer tarandus platyrhynchus]|uniref:Uncharacterized protein n=2 Tax=Rangifer tarandus platyrhynchus TaxID=3082113 RepID=A0ACB0FIX4_RANTA|nr:unnamed protein product [Rangifer tarandus platyrhynchus]